MHGQVRYGRKRRDKMDFEKIKEIMVNTLSCDEEKIVPEAKLSDDLKIDSLDAVELVMAIEEEMGVKTNLKYLGWFKIVNKGNAKDFVYAGLFYGVYDGKITMQASEVSTYYMMTLEEILARAEEFTPDSIIAIKEVVRLLNQKTLN